MTTESFLLNYLRRIPPDRVKSLCDEACSSSVNADEWFAKHEYVEVTESFTAQDGQEYTTDGRIVFSGDKKKWALREDVHAKNVKQELERKINSKITALDDDKEEWLSVFTCTRCGEQMQSEKVCSSCGIGKLGYAYKYSCACGVEFISKVKI